MAAPAEPASTTKAEEPIRALCVTPWSDRPEAETLIGLQARGCEIEVCCLPESPQIDRFREAGLLVTPVALRKRIDSAAIRALRARLRQRPVEILHLLHNRAVSNGLLAAHGFDDVKVITYRGIVGNVSFLSPTSWMRYLHPRVERVICVADAVRDHFLDMRLLGLRLPREKFVTIHKGHDLAWYTAKPVDRREFGIPSDAFVIGCVANIRPRKGIEVLVRAFGLLPEELPIWLLLAGRMDSPQLDRAIARTPKADRIVRAGFRNDAPALIAGCDVSVLPALRREGLPKTVIEAMAYGVPPIVTNVGGNPELVIDGQSGLVVPPGDAQALADAVLKLYGDRALARELGRNARRRIGGDFSINATIERTLALYRELAR